MCLKSLWTPRETEDLILRSLFFEGCLCVYVYVCVKLNDEI